MIIDHHQEHGTYTPSSERYDMMPYRQCGNSGLKLPAVSLGLWHNFGGHDPYENGVALIRYAFDNGVTHFDLANNYGPPPGSAEITFGKIVSGDLRGHRDELIISTKAGYDMWQGPYGNHGSRKHLIASIDQSLKRLGTDYVDIFYHHRPDPHTPLTETMSALDYIVRSGRALYAGISNYDAEGTARAAAILNELGTPLLIHQARYSMIDRWVEHGVTMYLTSDSIESSIQKYAKSREQTISQLAISWLLEKRYVTSVLTGASSPKQLKENISAANAIKFSKEEVEKTEQLLLHLAPERSK